MEWATRTVRELSDPGVCEQRLVTSGEERGLLRNKWPYLLLGFISGWANFYPGLKVPAALLIAWGGELRQNGWNPILLGGKSMDWNGK